MNRTRRNLLCSSSTMALVPLFAGLAACSTPTASATLSATVIADINGALAGLVSLPPQLEHTTPPVITQAMGDTIVADLTALQQSMATISASTALQAGTVVMERVFGGMNTAVAVLSAYPIPPPYNLVLMAVSVILPTVEAYLRTAWPTTTPPVSPPVAAVGRKAKAGGMSLSAARQQLGIN